MITTDLNQIVIALTDTLDLVGIDEVAHGKRVGYMAFKCACEMGLNKVERERLFKIGLLHDCGVSSTREHNFLVTELQWEGADAHAAEGERILQTFSLFQDYTAVVRYHHTPWCDLQALSEIDSKVALDANLIFLVDRVDAKSAEHYCRDLLEKTDEIRDWVAGLSGNYFAPELVEIFLQASAFDAFWLMLEPPHLERFIYEMNQHVEPYDLSQNEIKQLSRIFAYIVDAKSSYTAMHSLGVASLSRHLAQLAGLDGDKIDRIEIAGLLHDIGKLRIPDELLDKSGALSSDEKQLMHRHSFETYQVLRRIDGFRDIALWAAYHHETPDGGGYPFGRHGSELGVEARIISVADVFQALAQKRPYRRAMKPWEILRFLKRMAGNGKLDREIVTLVERNLQSCYLSALVNQDDNLLPPSSY
ncbi:MAG: HD domain-containing protein [Candidatus Thiodiazotropha sp. (ex Dulcina madagascariensis)]|nr:HD domain-containing protein [Candidatus Thiodiazotropha sp. (ex Dulcina madagascariensis)]MCU7926608.1 HD domain-containing protein [Candidatus Thiodiazotropha sp. (ex Dulcina madagascariensis)]